MCNLKKVYKIYFQMRKLQETLDFFKGIALQQNIDLFFLLINTLENKVADF